MKVLLQNFETGLYLCCGGAWTDNPEGALVFLNELRAADYCVYHRLPSTLVVVQPETKSFVNRKQPSKNP